MLAPRLPSALFVDSHSRASHRFFRAAALALQVYPLSRDEYKREVSDASKDEEVLVVIVLLFKGGIPDSRVMEDIVPQLADRHKAVKFVKMVSDQCIENYPDR